MSACPAGYAPWLAAIGVLRCVVMACTCPAGAKWLLEVVRKVPPAMALQASGGFLFALLGIDLLLADEQAAVKN